MNIPHLFVKNNIIKYVHISKLGFMLRKVVLIMVIELYLVEDIVKI